jgi:chromosome segregation ATPase
MKNPTVQKDELGILTSDKSVVLKALRKASEELKVTVNEKESAEEDLLKVRQNIKIESARLLEIEGRAVSVNRDIGYKQQELAKLNVAYDKASVRNSHEEKRYLGRIKELERKEEELLKSIDGLKTVYERNRDQFAENLSEIENKYRVKNSELSELESSVSESTTELNNIKKEEKKITKERLKREDKVRVRERQADARELAISKREEDVMTIHSDLVIMYGRLKELYQQLDPSVDLDKLIMKVQ